jgi:lactate dehydrogenase-like 2-hydroxyacid dehydrogenase
MKPLALQLCPFSNYLEDGLAEKLDLVRWFEMNKAAQEDFLALRSGECRLVVTGGHIGCPAELMRELPALGLVAINGVGFDKVDLSLSASRGVAVSNTPDVLTEDVADLAVGLVIALKRRIAVGDSFVRSGKWAEGDMPLGRKVTGSRFGIIGLGRIGYAIAQRLTPFGEVAYTARSEKQGSHAYFASAFELAEWADVLVVACAATGETKGLVGEALLLALGPQGILVNVSRGSVVDEKALMAALDSGAIAGAALDVFADEPVVPERLLRSERTVLTPHVGSATVETRQAMADLVLANITAFLAGRPLETPIG